MCINACCTSNSLTAMHVAHKIHVHQCMMHIKLIDIDAWCAWNLCASMHVVHKTHGHQCMMLIKLIYIDAWCAWNLLMYINACCAQISLTSIHDVHRIHVHQYIYVVQQVQMSTWIFPSPAPWGLRCWMMVRAVNIVYIIRMQWSTKRGSINWKVLKKRF